MTSLSIFATIVVTLIGLSTYRQQKVQEVRNATLIDTSVGIDEEHWIDVGDSQQWALVRGHRKDNPLLLFLHGGPGKPEVSYRHLFQNELERSVTIVHWDQRASGKSFLKDENYEETLTPKTYLEDASKVIAFLLKKYDKQKLFLLGHSWGSYLAMRLAASEPENIAGVIGMGQVVDFKRGVAFSYNKMLSLARKQKSHNAMVDLKSMGEPPYSFEDMKTFTKYLYLFGGELFSQKGYGEIVKQSYFSPEYGFMDHLNWAKGQMKSSEIMLPKIWKIELTSEVPKLDVPVAFFMGEHDLNTPTELVEEYSQALEAPSIDVVYFRESAHSPNLEEPEKFQDEVKKFVMRISQVQN